MGDDVDDWPERRAHTAVLEYRVRQLELGQATILERIEDVAKKVSERFDKLDKKAADSWGSIPSWLGVLVAAATLLVVLIAKGGH